MYEFGSLTDKEMRIIAAQSCTHEWIKHDL